MRYYNPDNSGSEVKVAVLVDEMRVDESSRLQASDILCGCLALVSAAVLFLSMQ